MRSWAGSVVGLPANIGCSAARRHGVDVRELATRDSVRLAETLSAWHVSPSWTIQEGARMAAVRAHHIFR